MSGVILKTRHLCCQPCSRRVVAPLAAYPSSLGHSGMCSCAATCPSPHCRSDVTPRPRAFPRACPRPPPAPARLILSTSWPKPHTAVSSGSPGFSGEKWSVETTVWVAGAHCYQLVMVSKLCQWRDLENRRIFKRKKSIGRSYFLFRFIIIIFFRF